MKDETWARLWSELPLSPHWGTLRDEASRARASEAELLEALKYVESAEDITDADWKRIRAAIAKAEGKP